MALARRAWLTAVRRCRREVIWFPGLAQAQRGLKERTMDPSTKAKSSFSRSVSPSCPATLAAATNLDRREEALEISKSAIERLAEWCGRG